MMPDTPYTIKWTALRVLKSLHVSSFCIHSEFPFEIAAGSVEQINYPAFEEL